MDNYIIKTLAYKKQVRILFVDNTELIGRICNRKNINKLLKTALGRTVSIASLISGILKGKQRVNLKVLASNRSYKIFADVDSMGNIRGYINDKLLNAPLDYTKKMSVEELIGTNGCIQVMKDLGMNSIFTGITDMPHGNIVDDFSYYFNQSEQTPSLFSLNMGFNEKGEIVLSRGILAQLLPDAPVELLEDVKRVISSNQLLLSASENRGDFKEVPEALFEDIEVLEVDPIRFFCGCSKEIFHPMLYSLKREELIDAYESGKPLEVVCNVCGEKYSFNREEIGRLI